MSSSATVKEPEKLPIIFRVNFESIPSGYRQVIEDFRKIAEQELFIWDHFEIELPPSALLETDSQTLKLKDLFVTPNFDECEELARDSEGNLLRLNRSQLQQVRQNGEFEVKSKHFPGEKHCWKLNRHIQKGTRNTFNSFLKDFSRALVFIVIYSKDRIIGPKFSLLRSFAGCLAGWRLITDLMFGLPYTNPGNVDRKLLEERLRFQVCELSVKASQKKYLDEFWDFFEQLIYLPSEARKVHTHNPDHGGARLPPYQYVTPSRLPIDLRLHNAPLMERCTEVLKALRLGVKSGWFQEFKDRMVCQLRQEGKSYDEIKKMVHEASRKEHISRLFNAMRESEDLSGIDPTIVEPLIRQARFYMILIESQQMVTEMWDKEEAEANRRLKKDHPILYLMKPWRQRQMNAVMDAFIVHNACALHEIALSKCQEEGLEQQAYFVNRDLIFLKEREDLLRKEFLKSSFPDTEYRFQYKYVFPEQWRVFRHHYDDEQAVETVVLEARPEEEPSLPSARVAVGPDGELVNLEGALGFGEGGVGGDEVSWRASQVMMMGGGGGRHSRPVSMMVEEPPWRDSETYFSVQKHRVFTSSTKYPFWRWRNFFLKTYVWLMTCLQLFLVRIPFRSRVSYCALFKCNPVYPKAEFCMKTGFVYRSQSGKRHTLASRLSRLWRHIRRARERFERAPPSGFLDRSVARQFHRFFTYVLQGALGTLALVLVMPVLCLLVSTVSILIGLLVPIWLPIVSLLVHLAGIVFYDFYRPVSRRNAVFPLLEALIWHLLLRGLVQALLALLVAFLVNPLLAGLVTLAGCLRFCLRSLWDATVFHVVIKRSARVPAKEDFVARRIAGPGTAANHFFQAKPEQILAVLESELEMMELGLFRQQVEMIARKPKKAYERFMETCMSPFSLRLAAEGKYAVLCTRESLLHGDLNTKLQKRMKLYHVELSFSQLNKVKLKAEDLNTIIHYGKLITEEFYNSRLKDRLVQLNVTESDWFEEKEIREKDYSGLCSHLLAKVFGEQFFTCLEDTDQVFKLEVNHLNLSRYMGMLTSAEFHEDLDSVLLKEEGRPPVSQTTYMRVDLPEIPNYIFVPHNLASPPTQLQSYPHFKHMHRVNNTRFKRFVSGIRGQRKQCQMPNDDKMLTQLNTIYHPVIIALLMHRRDREQHVLDLTKNVVADLSSKIERLSLLPTHWDSMGNLGGVGAGGVRTEDADTATTATSMYGVDTETGSGSNSNKGANGQEPDLLRSVQVMSDSRSSLDDASGPRSEASGTLDGREVAIDATSGGDNNTSPPTEE